MPQVKGSAVIDHHVAQHQAAAHVLLYTQYCLIILTVSERCVFIYWDTQNANPTLGYRASKRTNWNMNSSLYYQKSVSSYISIHTHTHTPPPPKIKNTDSSQFLWIHIVAPYIIYVPLVKLIFFLMI